MAIINGWGRGTWGQGSWSNPLPVEVTGVAGTSALGSESVSISTVSGVSAVAATSGLGD